MKYSDTLREFLSGYLHQELRIVTKVGTVEEGFLQSWNETDIVIAACLSKDKSSTIINLKDIVSITEKSIKTDKLLETTLSKGEYICKKCKRVIKADESLWVNDEGETCEECHVF